jgi:flagellar motor protein MotB
VVNFLSEKGVEASKLQPVGKGFKELLIPAEPLASQNRRVRIITLGQP